MKIGIDLGGSHVTIGLVNENVEIIEKRTYLICYYLLSKAFFQRYINLYIALGGESSVFLIYL